MGMNVDASASAKFPYLASKYSAHPTRKKMIVVLNGMIYIYIYMYIYIIYIYYMYIYILYVYIGSSRLLELHTMG